MEAAREQFGFRKPRRTRSWIEIGYSMQRGQDVACEFLLSEIALAITFLRTRENLRTQAATAQAQQSARDIHDAVVDWLPRVGVKDERVGRISSCLLELRCRLEDAGERF
jgi:hypothetical protein